MNTCDELSTDVFSFRETEADRIARQLREALRDRTEDRAALVVRAAILALRNRRPN